MSQYTFTLADTKAVALAAFNANFTEVYSTLGTLGTAITSEATTRANADTALASAITAKPDLGETSSTAYRGDRGKTAYDFSQTATSVGAALVAAANQAAGRSAIGAGTSNFSGVYSDLSGKPDLTVYLMVATPAFTGQMTGGSIHTASGIQDDAYVLVGVVARITTDGFSLASTGAMGWQSTTDVFNGTQDIKLVRAGAGSLAQRNGTADQTFTLGAASGTGGGVLVLHQIGSIPTPTDDKVRISFDGTNCIIDKPFANLLTESLAVGAGSVTVNGDTGQTTVLNVFSNSESGKVNQLTFKNGILTGFEQNI